MSLNLNDSVRWCKQFNIAIGKEFIKVSYFLFLLEWLTRNGFVRDIKWSNQWKTGIELLEKHNNFILTFNINF